MKNEMVLSNLNHTWIFDLDGTLVKHNGYLIDGVDTLLPGVVDFFKNNIKDNDFVVIITSRTDKYKQLTIEFLKQNNIRYDNIIFNAPMGERILINDAKPSGLITSKSINLSRDKFDIPSIMIDDNLWAKKEENYMENVIEITNENKVSGGG